MTTPQPLHVPVLLHEVVHAAAITPGAHIVDGTFGAGGYAAAFLAQGANVYAFDRDPSAIAQGAELAGGSKGRLRLFPARFSDMVSVLNAGDIDVVDAVVLDIGVSSMQLDEADRGFSFRADGPLDMRMGQDGPSAADFLNDAEEEQIANIIYLYGEERRSRRIAKAIVAARPLTRTGELAAVVRKALGYRDGAPKDPATRTFQAIRIHVNAELDELKDGLAAAERLLRPGGRLIVVSFHSLEDRIVKQFLRVRSGQTGGGSRHLPVRDYGPEASFVKPSKAIRAGGAELERNPRARSATLRWAERTSAPAWQEQAA